MVDKTVLQTGIAPSGIMLVILSLNASIYKQSKLTFQPKMTLKTT